MFTNKTFLFVLFFLFAVCLPGNRVYAFGAGNIPSFSYLEGKAFRHGDIEDALIKLLKRGSGGGLALGAILSKGHKFNNLDVKRVYFGNWLRDYSQAVDIAGLKKLSLQAIINLCIALGFLAHGYATHEFEVTVERLGVYLPTEHIDNPKGYGDGEDARKYDPRLRGPVDPMELEVDPDTGMKNYIANERGHWDTSKALVRRTLERCIHIGRMHRSQGRKQDEYEAYRLLGQALHTLEDFASHSNFCELTLVSMGHRDVFVHVGDHVRIKVPQGYPHAGALVAPLVTGTFGGNDFIHSLIGEATDKISGASVSDLNKAVASARSQSSGSRGLGSNPSDTLRSLLSTLPVGGGEMTREMESIERIRAGPSQGGKKPEDMSPQELHAVLWQVLTFRDSVMKKIEITINKVPGLNSLLNKISNSISVFVLTTLEPFLKPILSTATNGLTAASGQVIDSQDQYEVFNNPLASDPTHSFLSKDHFNLILNEPAGNISQIVVIFTVNLVVKAWDDPSLNVNTITQDILQCLFHPQFHDPRSQIQREMLHFMETWINGLKEKKHEILGLLSKDAVRHHRNIRRSGDGGASLSQNTAAYNGALQAQNALLGRIPGGSFLASSSGVRRDIPGAPMSGYPGASYGPPPGGQGYPPPPSNVQAYSNQQSPYPSEQQAFAPPPGPPPGTGYGQGGNDFSYPSPQQSFGPPPGPPHSFPERQYSYDGSGGPISPQASFSPPPGPPGGYDGGFSPPGAGFAPPPGGFAPGPPMGGFAPPPGPGGFGSGNEYGPPPGPPPSGYGSPPGGYGSAPGFPGGGSYGPPSQFPERSNTYPPNEPYQYRG